MFNKIFKIQVDSTTPFSGNDEVGITITGLVEFKDLDFFDDVALGKRKKGLREILSGELPLNIDEPIQLAFTPPTILVLTLPDDLNAEIGAELKEVSVYPTSFDDRYRAHLKIKLAKISEKAAGVIVKRLRHDIKIRLSAPQSELEFADKAQKAAEKGEEAPPRQGELESTPAEEKE